MASIVKRKGKGGKSSYQVRYRLPPGPDGKRLQATKTFKKSTDAKVFRAKVEVDQFGGLPVANSKIKMSDLFDRVLKEHAELSLAPGSVAQYRGAFKNQLGPAFGHLRASDVKPVHVQRFYRSMIEDAGLAENTARKLVVNLGTCFNLGIEWGLVVRNPVRGIKWPKMQRLEYRVLDEEQARLLIATVKGTDFHLPLVLPLHGGFREGEVLGLQWDCIDFENNTISIKRNFTDVTGARHIYGNLKTESSRRNVWVDDDVMTSLRDRLEFFREEVRMGRLERVPEQVCARSNGRMLLRKTLWTWFKRALQKADLDDLRYHDLRHTHATLLLRMGVPVHLVSRRLGHASIQVTLRFYAHVIPGDDRQVGEVIGKLLS